MGTNSVQWKNKLFSAKNFVAEEWMDKTKIKEIPRKDRIVGEKLLTYVRVPRKRARDLAFGTKTFVKFFLGPRISYGLHFPKRKQIPVRS